LEPNGIADLLLLLLANWFLEIESSIAEYNLQLQGLQRKG